ncbi:amino acid ABC transporter permease [Streptomyces virginiae]|uniref:amino acid ABC transporter permease n=1 Tax=Streptomyces virginiae TaxID=1961 RepID=UPI00372367A1
MKSPPFRRPEDIRVVPVRRLGEWVGVGVVGVLAAMFVHALVANPAFEWPVVWDILWDSTVLEGLQITLVLTVVSMAIGCVGGLLLTLMRLTRSRVLSGAAWVYIWVFRGTPVLVQLFFWTFLGALWPRVSIGIPFGPAFYSWSYNDLVPLEAAALLGLGLNEAAYMAEIVRAGVLSVDRGQSEAAFSLGMTHRQAMRRITLPQAMRVIIPPTGNEVIGMLKITSLVSAISLVDLTRAAQDLASRTFQSLPSLIAVSIWYLTCTSLLTIGQYHIERRFARGSRTADPAGRRRIGFSFPGWH